MGYAGVVTFHGTPGIPAPQSQIPTQEYGLAGLTKCCEHRYVGCCALLRVNRKDVFCVFCAQPQNKISIERGKGAREFALPLVARKVG